ncbi:prostaglandin D2 receptor [Drosophila rhopaloa]|uniref:G-protein coupled receptors family 1 profile domain-containing protein n=1 Tax=Drosophila rhopaloa TaxID=1041015 RepID=A0ABM5J196_DRORH|nr:prostaglandin D2 receptor [Drosophila rhopaloa]
MESTTPALSLLMLGNATSATIPKALYANRNRLIFGAIVMVLGVLGNSLALFILARKKHNKNSKYTLMLRCLATNNLVALLGMLTTTLLKIYLSQEVLQSFVRLDCVGHVVWRFFGLSSGCIAAVMAAERWMALARPFIYHKHITYELIRKSINSILIVAVIITFLPFVGFGAYIDESDPDKLKCIRYRDAEGVWNKSYAVLFMVFGTLLCIVIVACNLFVAHTLLCVIGRSRTAKRHMHYDLVRDKASTISIDPESSSGTTLYQTQLSSGSGGSHRSAQPARQFRHSVSVTMAATDSSPVEIKFAKLMAFLSISFVICWMPQMIAIPLAIAPDRVPASNKFFIIADVLTALHFTSDPYVYVLSRSKSINWSLLGCIKRWRSGWRPGGLRRSQSDQSRMRTTMTEANTLDFN